LLYWQFFVLSDGAESAQDDSRDHGVLTERRAMTMWFAKPSWMVKILYIQ